MSGARPDTWMPFYIGDYLADTMHLTRDQHGAYLLLIFAYWRRGQALPDDDRQLAAIARSTIAEWRRLRPVIARFFQFGDGLWHHKRIDAELGSAVSISDAKREAGRRGGEAARGRSGRPKNNSGDNCEKIPPQMAPQIADQLQNNTPSPSQSQKEEGSTEFSFSTELNSETPSSRSRVAARKNSRSRQPLPADWTLSEKGRAYARSKGWPEAQITMESEHFRDHSLAHGRLHADIEAAWRTWVQNAPKFAGNSRGTAHVNGTGLTPGASIVAGLDRAVRELEEDRGANSDSAQPVLDKF